MVMCVFATYNALKYYRVDFYSGPLRRLLNVRVSRTYLEALISTTFFFYSFPTETLTRFALRVLCTFLCTMYIPFDEEGWRPSFRNWKTNQLTPPKRKHNQ